MVFRRRAPTCNLGYARSVRAEVSGCRRAIVRSGRARHVGRSEITEDAQMVVPLDGAEITRRVEALLPEIDGRADEIAEARRLPRDLVDALKTTGVFRMSMPEAWGGSAL